MYGNSGAGFLALGSDFFYKFSAWFEVFYGGMITRNATVAMNAAPKASAASLSRVFSMTKSPKMSEYGARSSDVTSSMIAVTAIQRLMSQRERGKYT